MAVNVLIVMAIVVAVAAIVLVSLSDTTQSVTGLALGTVADVAAGIGGIVP